MKVRCTEKEKEKLKRDREREREMEERDLDLPPSVSFPSWLKQPGLGQDEARS